MKKILLNYKKNKHLFWAGIFLVMYVAFGVTVIQKNNITRHEPQEKKEAGIVLGNQTSIPCPYNECEVGDSCPNWYLGDPSGLCCVSKCNNSSLSTNFNPPFPRVAMQKPQQPNTNYCNGAPCGPSDGATPYIHSKYDMVAFVGLSDGTRGSMDFNAQGLAKEIKDYDRETIVLGKEEHISAIANSAKMDPRYLVHDKDGNLISGVFGKPINMSSLFNDFRVVGKKRIEAYDTLGFNANDFTYFDGVFYPEMRDSIKTSNEFCNGVEADFDGDGVSECTGSTRGSSGVYIDATKYWAEGVKYTFDEERKKLKKFFGSRPFVIVTNSGGVPEDHMANSVNGYQLEGWQFHYDWNSLYNSLRHWEENAINPHVVLFTNRTSQGQEKDGAGNLKWNTISTWKNRFTDMRYSLATALMGDAYLDRSFGWFQYIGLWYDEYEAELGYPLADPVKLNICTDPSTGIDPSWRESACVHVRFFDNGVAIVNPTLQEKTITISDLETAWTQAGLTGNAPDFYHILGGQDNDTNNGQKFSSAKLYGNHNIADLNGTMRGDGLILTTDQQIAVSDILVGTWYNDDTSPGSNPVEISSNWYTIGKGGISGSDNPYFTQWVEGAPDYPEGRIYHYIPPGRSEKAIFRPTIGVAGKYHIFEWHGWHKKTKGEKDEATNLKYSIVVNGSTVDSGTINQRDDNIYGQWNYLGTASLPVGTDSYVEYDTTGADGYAIADVIKFQYAGEKLDIAKDLNCDGVVNVYDVGIMMSCWDTYFQPNPFDITDPLNCANEANPPVCKSPDLTQNNKVDGRDFGALMSCWGVPDPVTQPTCFQQSVNNSCNNNGTCEASLGEDTTTCPADCQTQTQNSNIATPVITNFQVTPTNSFEISWSIQGTDNLDRVEIWRTIDDNNLPDANNWVEITSLRKTFAQNTKIDTDSAIDDPSKGEWWYGIHVYQKNGEAITEMDSGFVPIKVVVTQTGESKMATDSRLASTTGKIKRYIIDKDDGSTTIVYKLETDNGEIYNLDSLVGIVPEYSENEMRIGGQVSNNSSGEKELTGGGAVQISSGNNSGGGLGDNIKNLILLINFKNDKRETETISNIENVYFNSDNSVKNFLEEISYGKAQMTGDVRGYYTLDVNAPNGLAECVGLRSNIKNLIEEKISNYQEYNLYTAIMPRRNCGFGGVSMGNINLINNSPYLKLSAHEIIHSLGIINHAGFLDCPQGEYEGIFCSQNETGNPYDIMGYDSAPGYLGPAHTNGSFKDQLGWLEAKDILYNGNYKIGALEVDPMDGKEQVLKVGDYYVEYRKQIGFDENSIPTSGLLINKRKDDISNAYLLKAHSRTGDVFLEEGETFNDSENGIIIKAYMEFDSGDYMLTKIRSSNVAPFNLQQSIGGEGSVSEADQSFDLSFEAPYADKYQIQICKSIADLIFDDTCLTGNYSKDETIEVDQNDGVIKFSVPNGENIDPGFYYWRVKSINDQGQESEWSYFQNMYSADFMIKKAQGEDTIPPSIELLRVNRDFGTNYQAQIGWYINDEGDSELEKIEIMRAPNENNQPGEWEKIHTKNITEETNNDTTKDYGNFIDTQKTSGEWWYGVHATDKVGNESYKYHPIAVGFGDLVGNCKNGKLDEGEECDPTADPTGAPNYANCGWNCKWECTSPYEKLERRCVDIKENL